MAVTVFVFRYFITCSYSFVDKQMNYLDIGATDDSYNNLTSLNAYPDTMNFLVGTTDNNFSLDDNPYIRIRAYNANNKKQFIHNSSYDMAYCTKDEIFR